MLKLIRFRRSGSPQQMPVQSHNASGIYSTELLVQLIGHCGQLNGIAGIELFVRPDALDEKLLKQLDSTNLNASCFTLLPRKLYSGDFISLELQARVVGHELFGGSGDHFEHSGCFGKFLIGKHSADLFGRQLLSILQKVGPALHRRGILNAFRGHLKMIQLQKMDLQVVGQSSLSGRFPQAKVQMQCWRLSEHGLRQHANNRGCIRFEQK